MEAFAPEGGTWVGESLAVVRSDLMSSFDRETRCEDDGIAGAVRSDVSEVVVEQVGGLLKGLGTGGTRAGRRGRGVYFMPWMAVVV